MKIKKGTLASDVAAVPKLLTAPVYSITGLLVETLTGLALVDPSLVQCLAPSILSQITTAATTTTTTVMETATTFGTEEEICTVRTPFEENSSIGSSAAPVPIDSSTLPKNSRNNNDNGNENENNYHLDIDGDSDISTDLGTVRTMARCFQLLLGSLMILMDTPADLPRDRGMYINSIEASPIETDIGIGIGIGIGMGIKIVSKASTPLVSGSPSQLATSYTLTSSTINTFHHLDQKMFSSKPMLLSFRPLDADNSVRYLLSLIGFMYHHCSATLNKLEEDNGTEEIIEGRNEEIGIEEKELMKEEKGGCNIVHKGLIKALFCLPVRYYTEERFKIQLLPALQSIYEGREGELAERLKDRFTL